MVAVVAPVQILAGDLHGLNTLEHQPAKVMAMEGHFQSHPRRRAADPVRHARSGRRQRSHYAIAIPKASSLILKHDLDAPLAGLDTVDREDWPPVPIVFWSFRVMVGLGIADAAARRSGACSRAVAAALYDWRWLHRFALAMGPAASSR